eukprot:1187027-Prorocentrum_minimum.AAC.5
MDSIRVIARLGGVCKSAYPECNVPLPLTRPHWYIKYIHGYAQVVSGKWRVVFRVHFGNPDRHADSAVGFPSALFVMGSLQSRMHHHWLLAIFWAAWCGCGTTRKNSKEYIALTSAMYTAAGYLQVQISRLCCPSCVVTPFGSSRTDNASPYDAHSG